MWEGAGSECNDLVSSGKQHRDQSLTNDGMFELRIVGALMRPAGSASGDMEFLNLQ
jgi:hypothetical protein